jgi:dethiobiotin synthetase
MKKSKNLFITATNTDVGKTYTTLKLIAIYSNMGYRVGVMKPVESGVIDIASDATALLNEVQKYNSEFLDLSIDDICPIMLKLPAAPFVANNLKSLDLNIIKQSFEKLSSKCDILLIEGAGGLFTPLEKEYFIYDLIKLFDAKALLVCDDKLGCINNTLLNLNFLSQQKIDHIWAINQRDESFNLISKPYFDAMQENILYIQEDLELIANSLLSL